MKRAPNRVVAAVPAQPVGFRPELPTSLYDSQKTGWAAPLVKRRPEITMAMADQFLTRMFRNNPDFVFTVTRDFVKSCQTPVLVLPDDTAGHSLTVAIESAMLAPKGQLSIYPWKDTPEKIPLAVRHVRSFLLSRPDDHLGAGDAPCSACSLARTQDQELRRQAVASPKAAAASIRGWVFSWTMAVRERVNVFLQGHPASERSVGRCSPRLRPRRLPAIRSIGIENEASSPCRPVRSPILMPPGNPGWSLHRRVVT